MEKNPQKDLDQGYQLHHGSWSIEKIVFYESLDRQMLFQDLNVLVPDKIAQPGGGNLISQWKLQEIHMKLDIF